MCFLRCQNARCNCHSCDFRVDRYLLMVMKNGMKGAIVGDIAGSRCES